MRKTEFVHLNDAERKFLVKGTIAAEVPSSDDLLELTKLGNSRRINIKCGYSILKEDDNYCKKVGRELSSSRMKELTFFLDRSVYSEETVMLLLKNEDLEHPVQSVVYTLKYKDMKPFLVDASLF